VPGGSSLAAEQAEDGTSGFWLGSRTLMTSGDRSMPILGNPFGDTTKMLHADYRFPAGQFRPSRMSTASAM